MLRLRRRIADSRERLPPAVIVEIVGERGDHPAGIAGADLLVQDIERGVEREAGAVRAWADERDEIVGDGDDARGEQHFPGAEPAVAAVPMGVQVAQRLDDGTVELERYFDEVELKEGTCKEDFFNRCHLDDWKEFLDGQQGADAITQLDRVNRYMNRAPYITDPRNYNRSDYWATPSQFFNQDGDCEDYAIAKFMSLRALGWTNEHMRIVVLQDLNLRIPHAVLVVYIDRAAWVLDNQIEQLITADRIRHYRPFFSMTEESWWLHWPKKE